MSNEELEIRRRRAIYRAGHRGTKELDILLSRYAGAKIAGMTSDQLSDFEKLLEISEPDLQRWLISFDPPSGDDVPKLIADVRGFHGLRAD